MTHACSNAWEVVRAALTPNNQQPEQSGVSYQSVFPLLASYHVISSIETIQEVTWKNLKEKLEDDVIREFQLSENCLYLVSAFLRDPCLKYFS